MTTETLDSLFNKATDTRSDLYDRDPFKRSADKPGISFIRWMIVLALLVLLVASQVIRPAGVDTSGVIARTWCAFNIFCNSEEAAQGSVCVCPPIISAGD